MRLRLATILLGTVVLAGCHDTFQSRSDLVARAGDAELPVDTLAAIVVGGKGVPVHRNVIEQLADLWVDYTLFAERIASGDSLLDSATVVAAMWPEVEQSIANTFHDTLAAHRTALDSAQVDSVYRAGEYRLIRHILFRTTPDMSPTQKAKKKKEAEAMLAKLKHGESWAEASKATEEPNGAAREGSLGVITAHDQLVPAFLDAAFKLDPGQLSPVTETQFGYHIIQRPALSEVRDEYHKGLEMRLQRIFDSTYLDSLPARYHFKVDDGAVAAIRGMSKDPLRAKESRVVLGTYDGGTFRLSDFARWIQAFPVQDRAQIPQANDEQLTQIVRTLMRNEVLMQEAHKAGVRMTPTAYQAVRAEFVREIDMAERVMGLVGDTLTQIKALPSGAKRSAGIAQLVNSYLRGMVSNRRTFASIPPFLADRLRAAATWNVSTVGVDNALKRATEIKATRDSATAKRAAPVPTDTGAHAKK